MNDESRKKPQPADPAALLDVPGLPAGESSRSIYATVDGRRIEVPLLTLLPIPALTIDDVTVDFKMEVRPDGPPSVHGYCRTSKEDPRGGR